MLADGGTVHVRPIMPDDAAALVALPRPAVGRDHLLPVLLAPTRALAGRESSASPTSTTTTAWRSWPSSTTGSSPWRATTGSPGDRRGRGRLRRRRRAPGPGPRHPAARAPGRRRPRARASPGSSPRRCRNNRRCSACSGEAGFEQATRTSPTAWSTSSSPSSRPSRSRAIDEREHRAEARSVARLLRPRSVAVIGAGRTDGHDRPRGVPQPARRRLRRARLPGEPRRPSHVASVRAYPSVLDVPDEVDLAVIAVPAPAGPRRRRGVRARRACEGLVVITAGFARDAVGRGPAAERELVRPGPPPRHARWSGPNCMGVVNTAPAWA